MAASKVHLLVAGYAAALLAAAGSTGAQNELDVAFHGFQDSRGVTVLSPETSFVKDFSDRTAVRVRFGVGVPHPGAISRLIRELSVAGAQVGVAGVRVVTSTVVA